MYIYIYTHVQHMIILIIVIINIISVSYWCSFQLLWKGSESCIGETVKQMSSQLILPVCNTRWISKSNLLNNVSYVYIDFVSLTPFGCHCYPVLPFITLYYLNGIDSTPNNNLLL